MTDDVPCTVHCTRAHRLAWRGGAIRHRHRYFWSREKNGIADNDCVRAGFPMEPDLERHRRRTRRAHAICRTAAAGGVSCVVCRASNNEAYHNLICILMAHRNKNGLFVEHYDYLIQKYLDKCGCGSTETNYGYIITTQWNGIRSARL